MTFIQKNKSKLILVLVLIGFLLLNSFGFCWSKFRFLSDEERIELAVQKALNFYEGSELWGKTNEFITNENYGDRKKYEQMPYKTINEFFAKNPHCCSLSRSAVYSEGIHNVGMYGCLTGFSPYLISGNFTVFYKVDGQKNLGIGTSRFVYRMSSCGNLYYPDIGS